jgi:hypothetical protein
MVFFYDSLEKRAVLHGLTVQGSYFISSDCS